MKKIVLLILTVLLTLLLFSACGGNSSVQTESDTETNVPKTVIVTVLYSATDGGTIEGEVTQSKTVNEGESAKFLEVVAQPNEGYRFIGWDDGKTDAKRTDVLSASATYTAKFEKIPTVKIKYEFSMGGYVNGETEQAVKMGETTEAVVAIPFNGYRFVGWDDGNESTVRNDIAEADKTYTAIFEQIIYVRASYIKTTGGRITGALYQTIEAGQTTTPVTAVPDTGYRFIGWSDGVTDATRQDTLYENLDVRAIFSNEVVAEYKVDGCGKIEGESTQNLYWSNTTKEVYAIPDEGYAFIMWDDGVTTPNRTDKLRGDLTVTAIFKKLYTIDFACDKKRGNLEGELIQSVAEGDSTAAVTATPQTGYSFICWSNGETSPTIVVEASHSLTLTAYFSPISAGLPVVSIETDGGVGVTSKTEYVGCQVTLNDVDGGEHVIEEIAKIRGRGNSTWNFIYKPYKIKFEEKQDLLEMGKAKEWVLLANYGDISLVRNYLAYQTAGNLSELSASPDSRLVEVYLNGAYQGVYLLCEQVEVNDNRVEVEEDVSLVDTGYLIEMDEWIGKQKDGPYVVVNDNLVSTSLSDGKREYGIKFPDDDEITDEHLAFIKDYLERAIAAAEGDDYSLVTELIDVKSFAQMYLIAEIFKCPDVDYSSFYMYKDAGGKLTAGPVWDYDMAFGNVKHKEAEARRYDYLWAKEANPWFNALLKHSEFVSLVSSELKACEQIFNDTIDACYAYAYENREAMEKCFEDRKTVTTFFTPNNLSALPTWQEHMDQVLEFYENSMAYVKKVYLFE